MPAREAASCGNPEKFCWRSAPRSQPRPTSWNGPAWPRPCARSSAIPRCRSAAGCASPPGAKPGDRAW